MNLLHEEEDPIEVRKHGVDSVDDSDYDGDHDADGDGDDGDDGDGGVDYDRQCSKRDFVLLNSFNCANVTKDQ